MPPRVLSLLLIVSLLLLSVFALSHGALDIPYSDLFQVLSPWTDITENKLNITHYVVWDIRLPRLLTAIVVGMGLAAAGVCTQALFKNPLADPALIGVSNGAAVGAVCIIVFSATITQYIPLVIALPMAAFIAGLAATIIVVSISTHQGHSDTALLLLAGIAINAIAGALIGLLSYIADDNQLRDLTFWSMGSVAKAQWLELSVAAPLIIISCLVLCRYRTALNSLLLGENVAAHMGHDVKKIKRLIIILSTIIVATAVSISGVIFFVGLVVPHLIRLSCGPDHKQLLPLSMLSGSVLLLLADTFARMLIAPAELPIGLLMSLIGGPFFILLLLQQRKKGSSF